MSNENYNNYDYDYEDLEDIVDIDPQLFSSVISNVESYARVMDSAKSMISSGLGCLSGELRSKVSSDSAESSLSSIGDNYTVLASTINSSLEQYKKTEMNNYFDMNLYASGVQASFEETGLGTEEDYGLALDERVEMLEEVIKNWESERDKLQSEYDKLYGQGIKLDDPDTMRMYAVLLSALGIFDDGEGSSLKLDMVGRGKYVPTMLRGSDFGVYIPTDAIDYLYNYNKNTGILDMLTSYINITIVISLNNV